MQDTCLKQRKALHVILDIFHEVLQILLYTAGAPEGQLPLATPMTVLDGQTSYLSDTEVDNGSDCRDDLIFCEAKGPHHEVTRHVVSIRHG